MANTQDDQRQPKVGTSAVVCERQHPTITSDDIATVMWESNVSEEEARRRLNVPFDAVIPFTSPCSHTD